MELHAPWLQSPQHLWIKYLILRVPLLAVACCHLNKGKVTVNPAYQGDCPVAVLWGRGSTVRRRKIDGEKREAMGELVVVRSAKLSPPQHIVLWWAGFHFYCCFLCCAEAVLKSSIFSLILQDSQQIVVNRTAPSWALPVGTSAAASRGDKSSIITMHYPEPARDLMGFWESLWQANSRFGE